MGKTVSLPPVRVEPELLDRLQQIADELDLSVYELTRQAVAELIRRHEVKAEWAEAATLDEHEPLS